MLVSKSNSTQHSALDIVEAMLRETADAIMSEDFYALNACFHIPFMVETQDAKLMIDSEVMHRELFERLVEGYKSKGVTDILRVCEAAEFITPTEIRSLHTSHVMSGTQRVEGPVSTLATTKLFGDNWRIVSAQYVAEKAISVGRAVSLQASKSQ